MTDEAEAIKQLLDVLDDAVGGLKITGPDHEDLVWITCTPPDGDGISLRMGPSASVVGRAVLVWRDETAAISPDQAA